MICDYYGGPKDGDTVLLPYDTEVGFVHGVMMAHSCSNHPFCEGSEPLLVKPAFVALYRLNRIVRHVGRLDFCGYAKNKEE